MNFEGFDFKKNKPTNIDTPNRFDTTIVEKDIKNIGELLEAKKQELIELQNRREQLNEREEEMIEKYDIRIERIKVRINELENLLKSDQLHILEVNRTRDQIAQELFGGDQDKPEIIQ